MTHSALRFTLADRLIKARNFHGLTQQQAADRLGIGKRSLVRYESGDQEPDISVLRKYRDVLDIPLEWLLEDELGGGTVSDTLTGRYEDQLALFDEFDQVSAGIWHPSYAAAA